MPTVNSCPTGQEKYVIYSSPACGQYYGCRPTITTPPTPTPAPKPTTTPNAVTSKNITIANFQFSPASVEIAAGGSVHRTNNDSVPHQVAADDGSFQSSPLQPGSSFSHTFTQAGTYSYHCAIHPSMKGTIVVK
jgi:plastocyanin